MSELPESLVQVVRALVTDEDLALWFESLAEVPLAARAAEFRQMTQRMRASGADPELTCATSLLAAPGTYEEVLAAFHELRDTF